jgi:hypothetical protein
MSTNPDPIKVVEQEVLASAETTVELINKEVPTLAIVSWEQKNELAGQIWLAAGGADGDPLTLNHWLEAETTLVADMPATYNG